MHTPTTTTRENSGALGDDAVDDPRDADALEDHGALRASRRASPRRARRDATAPAARRELLHRADRELDRRRDGLQVAAVPGRLVGRVLARVDHDVGAARGRQRPPPGGEVARDDRAHALGLEHADHGQADRPAADHDRDVALLDLGAPDGVPADRHRLGQRAELGRQAVRDRQHQRLLDHDLLGVGAGRRGREADRVHLVAAPAQRQRHDRRAGGRPSPASRARSRRPRRRTRGRTRPADRSA